MNIQQLQTRIDAALQRVLRETPPKVRRRIGASIAITYLRDQGYAPVQVAKITNVAMCRQANLVATFQRTREQFPHYEGLYLSFVSAMSTEPHRAPKCGTLPGAA